MKGVTLPTETVFVMEASPIKFGLGATDEIAYDARRLGLKRVLIVTDRHIGELGGQRAGFAREHEGRHGGQVLQGVVERRLVWPDGLLRGRPLTPGVRAPRRRG